jgi:hypothetical protein
MGKFILDQTSSGLQRITCTTCERAIVKQPYITDEGYNRAVSIFKEHHDNCNGPLFNRITQMLEERGLSYACVKTAGYIFHAITTGQYNDMLNPDNKNTREVFEILTGIKLLSGKKFIEQCATIFNGKPIEVIG